MQSRQLCQYSLILILGGCFLNVSFAAACGESELLKKYLIKGHYRSALQEMDFCLKAVKEPSLDDLDLFKDLIKQVLSANNFTSVEEVSKNFQSTLNIHLFNGLTFQFAHYFETHPTEDTKLFSLVREAGEKYYFYYDTGRLFSHSRGIALTNKSLIWKNLTGKPRRLAFDDIQSLALHYDRSFLNRNLSFTGWKLQVNNDKKNDIRLSRMSAKAIMPFFYAINYFIHFNTTATDGKMIQNGWPPNLSLKHCVRNECECRNPQ